MDGGYGVTAEDLTETLAAMRKRHDEDIDFLVHREVGALLSAVEGVLAVHKPETRYTPSGYDECSFDTAEEAMAYGDDDEVYTFTVCAHCGGIEMGDESRRDYLESIWPCQTVKAIQNAMAVSR